MIGVEPTLYRFLDDCLCRWATLPFGATDRTRTYTPFREKASKAFASTCFATVAFEYIYITLLVEASRCKSFRLISKPQR